MTQPTEARPPLRWRFVRVVVLVCAIWDVVAVAMLVGGWIGSLREQPDADKEIKRLRAGWNAADRAYAEQADRLTILQAEVDDARKNYGREDGVIANLSACAERAEARLNAASKDDLAERLGKMKAYPLGLAGQDPLVGITRDDLAAVRAAADRIRMDAAQATPDDCYGSEAVGSACPHDVCFEDVCACCSRNDAATPASSDTPLTPEILVRNDQRMKQARDEPQREMPSDTPKPCERCSGSGNVWQHIGSAMTNSVSTCPSCKDMRDRCFLHGGLYRERMARLSARGERR